MSKVFVSYARVNKLFAQKLVHRLIEIEGDENVWIDWQDIPPTAQNFLDEIQHGIDAADTFLLILTPESLSSRVCNVEIARALYQNKRIVPLLYSSVTDEKTKALLETVATQWRGQPWETQAQANWKEISHINWILFRESDDFESAFASLVEAINTDLSHVKSHTRLIVRAEEWERSHQREDLLLRGGELLAAEEWAAKAVGKKPSPTDLQLRYIQQSRVIQTAFEAKQRRVAKRAQNFQRATMVFAVFVILAILAALFAINQARKAQSEVRAADTQVVGANARVTAANEQVATVQQQIRSAEHTLTPISSTLVSVQALADEQSALARTQRLAAQSRELVQDQLDLALLLSLESWRSAEISGQGSAEALNSLLVALNNSTSLPLFLNGHQGPVWSVDFDPTGVYVASTGEDGKLIIWNVSTGEAQQIISSGETLGNYYFGKAVEFTSDGQAVAVGWTMPNVGSGVALYDVNSGDLIRQYFDSEDTDESDNLNDIALSSDGEWLAVALGRQYLCPTCGETRSGVRIWNLRTGDKITYLERDAAVMSVLFSRDSDFLLSGGLVRLNENYSPASNADPTIQRWKIPAWQADSLNLNNTAIQQSSVLALLPTESNTDFAIYLGLVGSENIRSFSVRNGRVSSVNALTLQDVRSASQYDLLSTSGHLSLLGDTLQFTQDSGTVIPLQGHTGIVNSTAFNVEGTALVSGGSDGKVIVWQLEHTNEESVLGQRLINIIRGRSIVYFSDLRLSGDGSRLVAQSYFDEKTYFSLHDSQTGELLSEFPINEEGSLLGLNQDGTQVILAPYEPTNQVQVLDATTGELIDTLTLSVGNWGITYNPFFHMLLYRTYDDNTRSYTTFLIDLTTQQTLAELPNVRYAVFSMDGDQIFYWQDHTMPTLWNWQTDERFVAPTDDWGSYYAGSVPADAISMDGRWVATLGDENNEIVLLDGSTLQRVGEPLLGHVSEIRKMLFSPAGDLLVSVDDTGTIRLWDVQSRRSVDFVFPNVGQSVSESLTYTPLGRLLLVGERENRITGAKNPVIWTLDVDIALWKVRACRIANRELTDQERQEFGILNRDPLCDER